MSDSDDNDVIDPGAMKRLRESKATVAERDKKSGHTAGLNWAQHKAKADALERVAAISIGGLIDQDGTAHMELALAVSGEEAWLTWDEVREVLEDCFGSKVYPTFDEIVGFIYGAAKVHRKV